MNSLLLAPLLLFPNMILPSVGSQTVNITSTPYVVSANYSELTDTLYQKVKSDPVLPAITGNPDLTLLKKVATSSDLKFIAVGGKLSAGYRDGGLFRAGQLTAFPNLIAHQMGLSAFQSPLFDPIQGNGTGFWVMTTQVPYPEWKHVENNRAILQDSPLKLVKFEKGTPDNLSFPEGPAYVTSMPRNYVVVYPNQRNFLPFFNRILSTEAENKVDLLTILSQKAPDFCTFETRIDEFLGLAEWPLNLTTTYLFSNLDEAVVDQQLLLLKNQGTKLILFTIPPILDLPYFHIFSAQTLLSKNPNVFVNYKNNHINPLVADESTLFLPTESIRKTFLGVSSQGLSSDNPFKDEEVISADEVRNFQYGVASYNDYFIRRAGKKYNIPVVDLDALYKKILSNQYTTEDGTLIKGTFPEGDFFSADGRSPSAIGQAIIANETIKVINLHFKTTIPLIDLKRFKVNLSN